MGKKIQFGRSRLRRQDERFRVQCDVQIRCRDIYQKAVVVEFSLGGLRVDRTFGLAPGDAVQLDFGPEVEVEGIVVWSVWHKVGLKLVRPLIKTDRLYTYLVEQEAPGRG